MIVVGSGGTVGVVICEEKVEDAVHVQTGQKYSSIPIQPDGQDASISLQPVDETTDKLFTETK